MLRRVRISLAAVFFTIITLLFLDLTGVIHTYFGWMAKVQFLPALLALNVGVILSLILLTLIFGRIYCSVICPLGVFQDLIAWGSKKVKKSKKPYSYSKPKSWLRVIVLAIFVVAIILGINSLVSILAPYSSYGRIASSLFQPIYRLGNNLLASIAEHYDSYAFYSVEVWVKSITTLVVAIITLVVIFILAARGGRTYCNTICPVGTILGFFSKFSFMKIKIDESKCKKCQMCSYQCKSSCINIGDFSVDHSRCVVCGNCLESCKFDAINYEFSFSNFKKGFVNNSNPVSCKREESNSDNMGRRSFITAVAATTALSASAQAIKMDGGFAPIIDKKVPKRSNPITPAGSLSLKNLQEHCTSCQLCISVCPNQVLRPSSVLSRWMMPEMSYERGYCRTECNKCSEVCPTGAIKPISIEDKSSTQLGHAIWIKENCVVITDDVDCGNCAMRCPSNAIQMVALDPNNPKSRTIPAVDETKCIGCGACENLCPARPFSAIVVEGHQVHKFI